MKNSYMYMDRYIENWWQKQKNSSLESNIDNWQQKIVEQQNNQDGSNKWFNI